MREASRRRLFMKPLSGAIRHSSSPFRYRTRNNCERRMYVALSSSSSHHCTLFKNELRVALAANTFALSQISAIKSRYFSTASSKTTVSALQYSSRISDVLNVFWYCRFADSFHLRKSALSSADILSTSNSASLGQADKRLY